MRLFLLTITLICSPIFADTKDLVCTAKVSDEILNLSWIKPAKEREYVDGEFIDTDKYDPDHLKRYERCKNSEIAWQYSIRLDTNDIGKDNANVESTMIENCISRSTSFPYRDHGKTKAFMMKTTPSYLLFSRYKHFNDALQVDRTNLDGFLMSHKVKFECELKDVETQKKLL